MKQKIIDIRCRPPTKEYLSTLKAERYVVHVRPRLTKLPMPPSTVEESMGLFWQEFEEAGISKAVLAFRARSGSYGVTAATNDYTAGLVNEYPDKFVGIAGIDPTGGLHDPIQELERSVRELGLKGVAIDTGRAQPPMHLDDERLYPIYAKCVELDMPIFVPTSPFQGDSIEFNHPRYVERAVKEFPKLNIVISHGGWPYVMEYLGVAYRYSNLYLSPDYLTYLPGMKLYIEAANHTLEDQILFGTSYPIVPMKAVVDLYNSFPFSEETRAKVMYGNAQRLLRLQD